MNDLYSYPPIESAANIMVRDDGTGFRDYLSKDLPKLRLLAECDGGFYRTSLEAIQEKDAYHVHEEFRKFGQPFRR